MQEQWLDLVSDLGEIITSGGRSEFWRHTYPNMRSYNNSMHRLQKAGLLVKADSSGKLPNLRLTQHGRDHLPEYHFPETRWNARWNGLWYVLIFDVPESERHYRDTLRGFLKRLQMGCLQKSVWVTPRDIRPEYDDLERAANVHAVSYLLESRTVLHHESSEIVENAWNFAWLHELHERYLAVFGNNLQMLDEVDHDVEAVMNLLNLEAEAYTQCMRPDPLLPGELLPKDYLGKNVFKLHGKIRYAAAEQLRRNLV